MNNLLVSTQKQKLEKMITKRQKIQEALEIKKKVRQKDKSFKQ